MIADCQRRHLGRGVAGLDLEAAVAAALVATTAESVVGATLEKRGLLDNDAVNFLCSLTGALVAAFAAPLIA